MVEERGIDEKEWGILIDVCWTGARGEELRFPAAGAVGISRTGKRCE